MRRELKPVSEAMTVILADHRSSRIERILSAQIILSLHGCLLPAINEEWLSVKQVAQLRLWQRGVLERVLRKKAARKKQNRRTYLRRKIKELETQKETNGTAAH
jgi:hypothetical protein